MVFLLFFVYVVVEIAAFIALASWLGLGWTFLLIIAVMVLGTLAVRAQGRRVVAGMREAAKSGEPSDSLKGLADTALLAVSLLLLVLPGFVTSAVGLLLVVPPFRQLGRLAIVAYGTRKLVSALAPYSRFAGGGTIIEGEIVDTDLFGPGPVSGRFPQLPDPGFRGPSA